MYASGFPVFPYLSRNRTARHNPGIAHQLAAQVRAARHHRRSGPHRISGSFLFRFQRIPASQVHSLRAFPVFPAEICRQPIPEADRGHPPSQGGTTACFRISCKVPVPLRHKNYFREKCWRISTVFISHSREGQRQPRTPGCRLYLSRKHSRKYCTFCCPSFTSRLSQSRSNMRLIYFSPQTSSLSR